MIVQTPQKGNFINKIYYLQESVENPKRTRYLLDI